MPTSPDAAPRLRFAHGRRRRVLARPALLVVVFVATLGPARRRLGARSTADRLGAGVATVARRRRVRRAPAALRRRGAADLGPAAPEPSLGPTPSDVVLVGAGDIADCGARRRRADRRPARRRARATVFTRGDNAYDGRQRRRVPRLLRPDVGPGHGPDDPAGRRQPRLGHAGAAGYLGYFGDRRRRRTATTWYSRDLGAWHVIVLDSELRRASAAAARTRRRAAGWPPTSPRATPTARSRSGTTRGSAPASTATTRRRAVLGRRSTTPAPTSSSTATTTTTSGSRRRTRTATRRPGGIREIVVGTGGARAAPFGRRSRRTARSASAGACGVIRLTLHPAATTGSSCRSTGAFTDAGSDAATDATGATAAGVDRRPRRCATSADEARSDGGARPGGDHRRRRRRDVDRLPPRRARLDRHRPRRPGRADVRLDVPLGGPRRPAPVELGDPDPDDDVRRRRCTGASPPRPASTRRGTRSARCGSRRRRRASRSSSARRAGRRRSGCRSS